MVRLERETGLWFRRLCVVLRRGRVDYDGCSSVH